MGSYSCLRLNRFITPVKFFKNFHSIYKPLVCKTAAKLCAVQITSIDSVIRYTVMETISRERLQMIGRDVDGNV